MVKKTVYIFASIVCYGMWTTNVWASVILIESSSDWRTSPGSLAVTPDWISSLIYDDSDAAGWEYAFKSPAALNIWHTSNISSKSPSHARFRYLFKLPNRVSAANGYFVFDDDGSAYINGNKVIEDGSGGASHFDIALDPSMFVIGWNLIAVDGFNRIPPYNNIGVRLTLTYLDPVPGDFNLDSMVDALDLDLLLGNWGKTDGLHSAWIAPFDGFVDANELTALLSNWGAGVSGAESLGAAETVVPEPATLGLLLLGGLAAVRRRK